MRLPLIRCAAILLLAASAAAARAESIPPSELAADHRVCIAGCTQQGFALARCTAYCDCTFQRIGGEFTHEEYTAGKAASASQSPPQDLIDRMAKLTQACLAEMN